jgi:membrane associated rhomboid family serine protease
MRRRLQDLIIWTTPFITAVVGYILGLGVATNHTVCHGDPTGAYYCDTHAGHWAVGGLFAGLIIGGIVALALVRRRTRAV